METRLATSSILIGNGQWVLSKAPWRSAPLLWVHGPLFSQSTLPPFPQPPRLWERAVRCVSDPFSSILFSNHFSYHIVFIVMKPFCVYHQNILSGKRRTYIPYLSNCSDSVVTEIFPPIWFSLQQKRRHTTILCSLQSASLEGDFWGWRELAATAEEPGPVVSAHPCGSRNPLNLLWPFLASAGPGRHLVHIYTQAHTHPYTWNTYFFWNGSLSYNHIPISNSILATSGT